MTKPSTTSFYITTPIYYANDKPHIGTAYSTIAVDVFARYHKVRGQNTRSLTGLDEHGLKLERRAKEQGLAPQEFVDRMVAPFRNAWFKLNCSYNDFIRTTEARHKERVAVLWERVAASGDIYLGHYEDWYCVDCETFYTEKDLLPENICPIHKRPVERVKEESYFFRLSKYTDKLLAFYDANPGFVRPESRLNEVKSFVREGLRDLSVSRTSFRWGIPVPGHPAHVMYVWFDALANYMTALAGPNSLSSTAAASDLFQTFWPPNGETVHVVGKDILRFHAVFWPAFLMSAGLEPPSQVWAHGWLTVNGEKMSKSTGNFIAPEPIADALGADVLRYYLMRDIAFGQDGDFSHAGLLSRYTGELGNGLGNLLNRILATIVKNEFDGRIPVPTEAGEALTDSSDVELVATAKRAAKAALSHMDSGLPHRALESIWELVSAANKYVDQNAPWNLRKTGDTKRLAQVCYTTLEALRWLSVMLWPVMPEKCNGLRKQLGLPALLPTHHLDLWPSVWGGLVPGTLAAPGDALFPRLDPEQEKAFLPLSQVTQKASKEAAQAATKNPKKASKEVKTMETTSSTDTNAAPSTGEPAYITIDDLAKIDLRLGLIVAAERVEKSDKLLKLQVDLGEASPRQILSGIAKHYGPEDLVGKRVTVVANLPPRKMMGMESQGMILAASDDAGLSALFVDKDVAPGSSIK